MVALIVLLVRTQSQEVFLSQSVAGRSLQEYFDQRFLGVVPQNQLCRAVLILPERHDDTCEAGAARPCGPICAGPRPLESNASLRFARRGRSTRRG